MSRVDGLSFRSKPDLLQRHKTNTNTYPVIEKERGKGLYIIIYVGPIFNKINM